MRVNNVKLSINELNLYYGDNHALKDVSMDIYANKVTAFIGPSGCGKSTFLKTLNRMNDLVENVRITGDVRLEGQDIYADNVDTTLLRENVGMVFQQPNPFPMSIYDNIAYGPRVHGIRDKHRLDQIVEESLRGAAIFDEVKDRLKKSALGLSGGQQQRICIARALAVKPSVLLMDEPTSALDPISTSKIEDLMEELKKIDRIIEKEVPQAHRENLVVLDGTTGQNALSQAREFGEVADLTGIILTKMDGTAKGGIAVAIQSELKIPVKYIGVGESIEDLQKFDADQFVDALFNVED